MFISEVQNKNALQRTLMSHRTMIESAQWTVGAVRCMCFLSAVVIDRHKIEEELC